MRQCRDGANLCHPRARPEDPANHILRVRSKTARLAPTPPWPAKYGFPTRRARWALGPRVKPEDDILCGGDEPLRSRADLSVTQWTGTAMASESQVTDLACRLLDILKRGKLSIVTAESCTAGQLANVLSHAPGASEYLHGGFITYTKAHKTMALGISSELLRREGAVCGEVAIAMAEGALIRSPATLAVAITGAAGPEPDEDGNTVGRVCIAVARVGHPSFHLEKNYGDIGREAVTARAVEEALVEAIRVAESD